MAIIQRPDALSLSGNLIPFKITSAMAVSFSLSCEGTLLLEEKYYPSGGVVMVDVKKVVESQLKFSLQTDNSYTQPNLVKNFRATVDGTNYDFRVIRAGVLNFSDTATNFLRGNFLTWQEQKKGVSYYSPEFLTYYATSACVAKLTAYYESAQPRTITLLSMASGSAYTINLNYAAVYQLLSFEPYPYAYDVHVETTSGERMSYVQRYLVSDRLSEDEEWVLFENSLGGIDTIRAYGSTDFEGKYEHNIVQNAETLREDSVVSERRYTKNTGYLTDYQRRWILDFFPSPSKYIFSQGAFQRIVVVDSSAKYKTSELPSSFTFTYRFSEDKPFLKLVRSDSLPENLVISIPESPDFFLSPRLAEFPSIPISTGIMIPVQGPNSDVWSVITLGGLLEFFGGGDTDYLQEISQAILNEIARADAAYATKLHTHSTYIKITSLNQPLGPAGLDANGMIPEQILPTYFKSVLEKQGSIQGVYNVAGNLYNGLIADIIGDVTIGVTQPVTDQFEIVLYNHDTIDHYVTLGLNIWRDADEDLVVGVIRGSAQYETIRLYPQQIYRAKAFYTGQGLAIEANIVGTPGPVAWSIIQDIPDATPYEKGVVMLGATAGKASEGDHIHDDRYATINHDHDDYNNSAGYVKAFKFVQGSPSSTWTIDHNLGRIPAIVVTDSAGTEVYGSVSHPSVNQSIIMFSAAFSGVADLN